LFCWDLFTSQPRKKKGKKDKNKSLFDEGFTFTAHDNLAEQSWNLDMAIKIAKKKDEKVMLFCYHNQLLSSLY
jgi:hypothetical protein